MSTRSLNQYLPPHMYINAIGHHIPAVRVHNDYFLAVNGLTDEWIYQRTGIKTRSKVTEGEDGNTMGIQAIRNTLSTLPYPIEEVDLIISCGYAPVDTVGTLGHLAQREFKIEKAKVVLVSSACSSFVNAVEIVEGYFAMNKASKALIVCSEHNTLYSNVSDPKAGHLWGDAAVALFISKDPVRDCEPQIKEVHTQGLGHIGKGPEGVYLRPRTEGIQMPDGRDVFINATKYMVDSLERVTSRQGITINDLDFIASHQANMRIISNISDRNNIPIERFLCNIEELGNTGAASSALTIAQNFDRIPQNCWVGLTVFGGGYSTGSLLIRF